MLSRLDREHSEKLEMNCLRIEEEIVRKTRARVYLVFTGFKWEAFNGVKHQDRAWHNPDVRFRVIQNPNIAQSG